MPSTDSGRPQTLPEMLEAAAWFLDKFDELLVVTSRLTNRPYEVGDEAQRDLRRLARFFKDCPELAADVYEATFGEASDDHR